MIICRVCLDNSERLIPLQSDNIEALPIVHMLKEFTIINLEHQLPKYICEPCAGQLDIAYAFKRKYEDSIVRFVRQMSDPIEKEEVTSESSSTMTEDVPGIKQHETMNFNYPNSSPNCFTVTEDIVVEDSKDKLQPQLLSLMDDLRPSDDMERLTSDESTDETQYETADHSSTGNDSDAIYRSLPQAVLNKIYKFHYGHGAKPFKCDVCYRWFKTKGHIKAHRMRHIERENRIKCNKCLLMFLTKPHFNKHRCSTKSKFKVSVDESTETLKANSSINKEKNEFDGRENIPKKIRPSAFSKPVI